MLIKVRILLFTICILTSFFQTSYAADNSIANPEILEPNYVQITLTNTQSRPDFIFYSIKNVTAYFQQKYESLLNWQYFKRGQNKEIPNYNRLEQFGKWIDDPNDQNCLNTRAKVLIRDSKQTVTFKDDNPCVVEKGKWDDPYTNSEINDANEVQIDHLVALKNAYISGAYRWNYKTRCLYANYLGYDFHLLSVDGDENIKKSDKSPDKYLPPDPNYTCTYVRNWLAVKMLWGLSMTIDEARAISKQIDDNHCPLSQFKVSTSEINRQRRFAQANMELCGQ